MKFLTFKDLKASGIAKSWPVLNKMIEEVGFPTGFRLSQQRLVWAEEDVKSWLATRAGIPAPKPYNRKKPLEAAQQ